VRNRAVLVLFSVEDCAKRLSLVIYEVIHFNESANSLIAHFAGTPDGGRHYLPRFAQGMPLEVQQADDSFLIFLQKGQVVFDPGCFFLQRNESIQDFF
jgi:hypothetical protein